MHTCTSTGSSPHLAESGAHPARRQRLATPKRKPSKGGARAKGQGVGKASVLASWKGPSAASGSPNREPRRPSHRIVPAEKERGPRTAGAAARFNTTARTAIQDTAHTSVTATIATTSTTTAVLSCRPATIDHRYYWDDDDHHGPYQPNTKHPDTPSSSWPPVETRRPPSIHHDPSNSCLPHGPSCSPKGPVQPIRLNSAPLLQPYLWTASSYS